MIPLRDLNPSRRKPVVTVALIAANCAAFLYELSLGPQLPLFIQSYAFAPERLSAWLQGEGSLAAVWGSVCLSLFLHGGWAHIAGNMIFLWIFGDNVEDRLGHARFIAFYFLAGLAATLAHSLASPGSSVPTVGASGAISAVLGAYLVLFPGARIVTLVFLGFFIDFVQVPALVYLPLWFLMQFVSGLASLGASTAQGAGVAWFAHIGGFLAGPALLFALGGWRRR